MRKKKKQWKVWLKYTEVKHTEEHLERNTENTVVKHE